MTPARELLLAAPPAARQQLGHAALGPRRAPFKDERFPNLLSEGGPRGGAAGGGTSEKADFRNRHLGAGCFGTAIELIGTASGLIPL